jgi:hypothetical protein
MSFRTNQHQPSPSSTFISEQISTSHQPPAKRTGCEFTKDEAIYAFKKQSTNHLNLYKDYDRGYVPPRDKI